MNIILTTLSILLTGFLCLAGAYLVTRFVGQMTSRIKHIIWVMAFILPLFLHLGKSLWSFNSFTPSRLTMEFVYKSLPEGGIPIFSSVLMLIYFAGVFYHLVRLVAARIRMSGIIKRSQRCSPETEMTFANVNNVKKPSWIFLRRSGEVETPVTTGIFVNWIVIPLEADAWSEDVKRMVFAHELAHIRRRDLIWNAVCQVLTFLQWPNPVAWFGLRQIHLQQEKSCDEMVLSEGFKTTEYARLLINHAGGKEIAPMSVYLKGKSDIHGRIHAVLRPDNKGAKWSWIQAVITIVILLSTTAGGFLCSSFSVLTEGAINIERSGENEGLSMGEKIKQMQEKGMSMEEIERYYVARKTAH